MGITHPSISPDQLRRISFVMYTGSAIFSWASVTFSSNVSGEVGIFSPPERYGSLIVKNESGAAFHSDDVESHIVFDPIVPEIQ